MFSAREVDAICEPLGFDAVDILSAKILRDNRAAASKTNVHFIIHRKEEGGNSFMEKLFVFPPDKRISTLLLKEKSPLMVRAPMSRWYRGDSLLKGAAEDSKAVARKHYTSDLVKNASGYLPRKGWMRSVVVYQSTVPPTNSPASSQTVIDRR